MALSLCEKYMLTSDNILKLSINEQFKKNLKNTNNLYINSNKLVGKKNTTIDDSDVLFWTIYNIVNEEDIYKLNNIFKIEKEFKIKSIEDLRKIKSELKAYKFRLTNIEDQLLNKKKIGLDVFFSLCLLFKLNVFYIWNNKYIEFYTNKDSDKIYIIKYNNEKIIIENNLDNNINLDYYRNNYYYIENINKPIKSMSNYSKEELLKIAVKLEINIIDKKILKKDLYQLILIKM